MRNEPRVLCRYKYQPAFFALLASVLAAAPDVHVWLLAATNEKAGARIAARLLELLPEAAARVKTTKHLTQRDFSAALLAADAVLDAHPFGSGVTAVDALAVGTPVVTLPSRMRSVRLANG